MGMVKELGIGLMAKAPQLGKVKTRLSADIGAEKATAVYRELLQRLSKETIEDTRELLGDAVEFCWFADPKEAIPQLSKEFAGFQDFFAQCQGDLGTRMRDALEVLLQRYKYAALIGADIPDISAEHIRGALSALRDHEVVLGPTYDGGYYLIGSHQAYGQLFEDIPWSASDTLSRTINACEGANLNYHLLEPLGDLDVLADFQKINWRPKSIRISSD